MKLTKNEINQLLKELNEMLQPKQIMKIQSHLDSIHQKTIELEKSRDNWKSKYLSLKELKNPPVWLKSLNNTMSNPNKPPTTCIICRKRPKNYGSLFCPTCFKKSLWIKLRAFQNSKEFAWGK